MIRQIHSALAATLLLAACGQQAGDDAGQESGNTTAASPATDGSSDGSLDRRALYPGSGSGGAPDRFATSDPIDRVIAWYRDPARRGETLFVSTEEQDDGYLVLGTVGEEPFAMKVTSRPGGGTEARHLPYDPKKGLRP